MRRRIRKGDYVLITEKSDRYLQIGEVIEVINYPRSNDVALYKVRFPDMIDTYDYNLIDNCRVLILEI